MIFRACRNAWLSELCAKDIYGGSDRTDASKCVRIRINCSIKINVISGVNRHGTCIDDIPQVIGGFDHADGCLVRVKGSHEHSCPADQDGAALKVILLSAADLYFVLIVDQNGIS